MREFGEKEAVYLKVIQIYNNGRFLSLSPSPFKNIQKYIILLPFVKPGSFRIRHSEVPSFRKAEFCNSAFPVTVQLLESLRNLGVQAGPCSSIRSAAIFSRQTSRQTSSWQTSSLTFSLLSGPPLSLQTLWFSLLTFSPP